MEQESHTSSNPSTVSLSSQRTWSNRDKNCGMSCMKRHRKKATKVSEGYRTMTINCICILTGFGVVSTFDSELRHARMLSQFSPPSSMYGGLGGEWGRHLKTKVVCAREAWNNHSGRWENIHRALSLCLHVYLWGSQGSILDSKISHYHRVIWEDWNVEKLTWRDQKKSEDETQRRYERNEMTFFLFHVLPQLAWKSCTYDLPVCLEQFFKLFEVTGLVIPMIHLCVPPCKPV